MKTYTVLVKKGDENNLEEATFIKEGFSLWAAVFQVLWALFHKMWLCAAALIVVAISFLIVEKCDIIKTDMLEVLRIGLFVFIGFSANDWYLKSLHKKDYIIYDIVTGNNEDEAKRRFFDRQMG